MATQAKQQSSGDEVLDHIREDTARKRAETAKVRAEGRDYAKEAAELKQQNDAKQAHLKEAKQCYELIKEKLVKYAETHSQEDTSKKLKAVYPKFQVYLNDKTGTKKCPVTKDGPLALQMHPEVKLSQAETGAPLSAALMNATRNIAGVVKSV